MSTDKNSPNSPEPIDQETIEKIKKELMIRREQLIKDLNEMSGNKENKNDLKVKFPDFGDKSDENAQEIGEYSTNIATEKVLESTLRDIENTLERIEKGTYGICKYCGKPIGKKRMLARNVASACVACKTKLQSQV